MRFAKRNTGDLDAELILSELGLPQSRQCSTWRIAQHWVMRRPMLAPLLPRCMHAVCALRRAYGRWRPINVGRRLCAGPKTGRTQRHEF